MIRLRTLYLFIASCLVLAAAAGAQPANEESPTVGVAARIEQVVLPGTELEAKPFDRKSPVVVRVLGTYPHGTEFRYDLEYYGLEPGEYDLKDYLQRKDGSELGELPSIPVTIRSLLPKGQIEPNPVTRSRVPWLGGYQLLLIGLAVLWFIGLFGILFIGRKKNVGESVESHGPKSFSQRLRPMIEDAIAGRLSTKKQAELERLLLAFWRRRLGLENLKHAQALMILREHQEAGVLLRQLESWLHAPLGSSSANAEATIKTLLEPYSAPSMLEDSELLAAPDATSATSKGP